MLHAQIAADVAGIEPHLLRVPSGQGASGVDLFFVISGFIMVHVQGARPQSPATAMPPGKPGGDLLPLAAVALTTIAGLVRHRLVERPLDALLRGRPPGRPLRAA